MWISYGVFAGKVLYKYRHVQSPRVEPTWSRGEQTLESGQITKGAQESSLDASANYSCRSHFSLTGEE